MRARHDNPAIRLGALYTGWFRCFLADDADACMMFESGAECPVCKDQGWAETFAKNY